MPTTATYSHYYSLGMTNPLTLTHYPNLSANVAVTTLTDDEDGVADGVIALNAAMSWSAASDAQLIGVTDTGNPVIVDTGFYYILTNRGDLHNSPLSISQTSFTMCFAAGTSISTPAGEVPVETLKIGDLVRSADGRDVPAKWIGRQTLNKFLHRDRAQMVRIRRGALGDDLPHCDLTITRDHGMVLEGLVINASALVNGTTVNWVPVAALEPRFSVYHIETEAHDVILANGAASETFVDSASRRNFDNFAEYRNLFGEEDAVPELAMPRVTSARMLPASIRQRLALKGPDRRSA